LITLEQWKKNFLDQDTCPWRGPKPMEPGDDDLLIGRQDDRDRFAHEVLTHQLVILHGESGVGKSSLLNVGLVRDLTERGFQPIVCRNWTREAGSPDRPEDFVAAKVATELRSLGIDVGDAAPQSMVEQLNANYGELAVLVLDQFEELIRHQRPFFKRAMDWVVDLNSRYDIHVVISLRSEYVHRLKALNAQIRPFSMSTFELEALTAAECIRDIMASGNPGHFGDTASLHTEDAVPDPAGLAITLEAIELLLGEWNTIQETEFRSADVGLLHLQGALYALHARAEPGGNAIRAEHVRQMIAAAAQRQRDIFTLGLIESVARKLDLCEQACLDDDPANSLDEFLIAGTREAVRRTAAHLSSGGFKLDREAWDLAQLGGVRARGARASDPQRDRARRGGARLPDDLRAGDHGRPGRRGGRGSAQCAARRGRGRGRPARPDRYGPDLAAGRAGDHGVAVGGRSRRPVGRPAVRLPGARGGHRGAAAFRLRARVARHLLADQADIARGGLHHALADPRRVRRGAGELGRC